MKLVSFTIPDSLAGQRLMTVIRRMAPNVAEYAIRDALHKRDVKLDHVRADRNIPVFGGELLQMYLPDTALLAPPAIVYEDEHLLVVNKPAGVSSDAQEGMSITQWMDTAYPNQFTGALLPCHRLDNPTSGLLMLAKDEATRAAMEIAFRAHQIHKQYLCRVRGTPVPAHAVLDAFLIKDAAHATVTVLDNSARGALPIRTEYQVLEAGDTAKLRITLHTGRTHQIRAHLAHIGHPLLGDDKYGDRSWNKEQKTSRLMLAATELSFSITGSLAYLNEVRLQIPDPF